MHDFYVEYFWLLFGSVPLVVYLIAIMLLAIGGPILVKMYGRKKGLSYIMVVLFIEYVFILYGSTVFFRQTNLERTYNFTPFWSYMKYFKGEDSQLLAENIMNIAVFIPVGFVFGWIISKGRLIVNYAYRWLMVVVAGVVISLGVELLQFVLQKGMAEIDDMVNNTIGCLLGFCIYLGANKIYFSYLRSA